MSKLAIFLCVAIFASAANASFWSEELQSVRSKLKEVVSGAINQLKAKFEAAKEKADKLLAKLNDAALSVTNKVTKRVESIVQRVQASVKKITDQGRSNDVSHCRGFTENLDRAAVELYVRMGECVDRKVRAGIGYLEAMHTRTDKVINDLKDLRVEGLECGKGIDGLSSTIKAVFCTKVVKSRAVWTAVKAVPSLTLNFGKMTYLLSTLEPSLAYCGAKHTLVTFAQQAVAAVKRVEKCVREKLGNAYKRPQDVPIDAPWDDLTNPSGPSEQSPDQEHETVATESPSNPTTTEKVSTTEASTVAETSPTANA